MKYPGKEDTAMKKYVERYTTAPEAYDGFGTKTIEIVGYYRNDPTRPVRKISVNPDHLDWQSGRNGSGLHPTWTEEQFQELVKYGYIGLRTPGDVALKGKK